MADVVLSLTHFQPPNPLVRLRLDRFSPYHRNPEAAQISILGPYPLRQFIYDLPPEQLEGIEQCLSFRYNDGRNPDDYVRRLVSNCDLWRASWRSNFRRLSWHRHGSDLRIYDTRFNTPRAVYELGQTEGLLYLACDSGATPRAAWEALPSVARDGIRPEEVKDLLVEMTRLRLMFADGNRFLSLAVEGDDALRSVHEEGGPLPAQAHLRISD